MNKLLTSILITLIISGCAGSANHKVMTENEAKDFDLECGEINSEMAKAQDVINAVNEDKSDINGADVIDGILWFPFNLIAKSSNYNNALKAADKRIARLTELKKEKGC